MVTGDVVRSGSRSRHAQSISTCITVAVFILFARHISPVLGLSDDKAYSCQEIHEQLEHVKSLLGEQAHIALTSLIVPCVILLVLLLIKMIVDWLRRRTIVRHMDWWEETYVGNEEKNNSVYIDYPDDDHETILEKVNG